MIDLENSVSDRVGGELRFVVSAAKLELGEATMVGPIATGERVRDVSDGTAREGSVTVGVGDIGGRRRREVAGNDEKNGHGNGREEERGGGVRKRHLGIGSTWREG